MQAVLSFEESRNLYQTTRRHIVEASILYVAAECNTATSFSAGDETSLKPEGRKGC
jgi:hypothetical protein